MLNYAWNFGSLDICSLELSFPETFASRSRCAWNFRSLYRQLQMPVSLKVPPAIQISDAFGKRRPLGRYGGGCVELHTCELQRRGWLRVGRAMSIVVYCVIIDVEGNGSAW